MEQVDKQIWQGLSKALSGKGIVTGVSPIAGGLAFTLDDGSGSTWSLTIRPRTSYIIGIDTVGYSRRSMEGQFMLTTWLFSIIRASIDHLRGIGWVPGNQPSVLIPTGDGAMLVLDDKAQLGAAAAIIYRIQMMVEDTNRHRHHRGVSRQFNKAQPYPITPIHCRYALVKGEVVPMSGLNNEDNFVGPGLVTCARVLATSKGAHYLIDSQVMDDFDQQGGIDGNMHMGAPWDWGQTLHTALMQEKKIKTATLSIFNVFGKFKPVALLLKKRASRGDAKAAPEYHIGSHDVSTIIG